MAIGLSSCRRGLFGLPNRTSRLSGGKLNEAESYKLRRADTVFVDAASLLSHSFYRIPGPYFGGRIIHRSWNQGARYRFLMLSDRNRKATKSRIRVHASCHSKKSLYIGSFGHRSRGFGEYQKAGSFRQRFRITGTAGTSPLPSQTKTNR